MTGWRDLARLAGRMLAQVDTARAIAATLSGSDPAHAQILRLSAAGVEVVCVRARREARAAYAETAEA